MIHNGMCPVHAYCRPLNVPRPTYATADPDLLIEKVIYQKTDQQQVSGVKFPLRFLVMNVRISGID